MVYRIDNRPKKHRGRYTILGIVLGISITIAGFYLYDTNKPVILDNANQIKNFAIKQIPKDSPIIPVNTDQSESIGLRIHELVNNARIEKGLNILKWSDKIKMIAKIHSDQMLTNDDFSHDGLSDRLIDMGCPDGSENIETMNGYHLDQVPQVAINDWLNSYGHRANVLSNSFTSEGIGVSLDGNHVVISEDFC